MPIRGSPNGAAHSCPRFSTAWQLVDAIARNSWTPSLGMVVDAINRYGWTSSIGSGGRHHSVRPTIGVGRRISHYVDELTLYFTSVSITLFVYRSASIHIGNPGRCLFRLRLRLRPLGGLHAAVPHLMASADDRGCATHDPSFGN